MANYDCDLDYILAEFIEVWKRNEDKNSIISGTADSSKLSCMRWYLIGGKILILHSHKARTEYSKHFQFFKLIYPNCKHLNNSIWHNPVMQYHLVLLGLSFVQLFRSLIIKCRCPPISRRPFRQIWSCVVVGSITSTKSLEVITDILHLR